MVKTSLVAGISALLSISACVASQAEQKGVDLKSIHSFASQIREAQEPARSQIAAAMAKYVSAMNADARQTIRASDIDDLANLLTDKSPTVQYFAADTLGELGPFAKAAVPAIRAAILRIEAEERAALLKPSLTGAAPLYEAIHKITGEPVPDKF